MGWLEEQYKNTGSVGDDGKFSGRGLGAFLWQQFVDEDKVNKVQQRTINTRTALAGDEDIADLKGIDPETASVYEVQGALKSKGRERNEAAEKKRHTRGIEAVMAPVEAQIEARGQAIGAQLEQTRGQNALTNKRLDNQLVMQLQEMAANRDSQAAQLEYQKMRDRRSDQEYNERMERLDRKDRQAMMQNLAAGLASLGAAFAL